MDCKSKTICNESFCVYGLSKIRIPSLSINEGRMNWRGPLFLSVSFSGKKSLGFSTPHREMWQNEGVNFQSVSEWTPVYVSILLSFSKIEWDLLQWEGRREREREGEKWERLLAFQKKITCFLVPYFPTLLHPMSPFVDMVWVATFGGLIFVNEKVNR